jgi:hypothetical protein
LVERLEIAKQEDDELQASGKEPARPFSSPFWWKDTMTCPLDAANGLKIIGEIQVLRG